ncbi:MAG: UDP-N-acetylmuramoyl-L-alanine--D-glutamate ligase [Spirochaetaceae bacterium]|nr:UDP-N-acetylmuramoyl-L-alanine--D-glutamate ligase [Myxococcales bacterium]MCB9724560.1 UDP-N-acetylmuramoyl-L-alanine--D-glutamate ligase [Spirochaetaceae bacterium]HPG26267.1 UDP-N-acetylmuramoyl-L-alanine--D-glutamate ligase [Myxococcota bacterium]
MEFAGQKVLVLGLGVSGRSAADYCARRGARVTVADERPADAIEGLDALPAGVGIRVGEPFPELSDFDLVVPSPGVPAARWEGRARRAWGDIELCSRALRVPIVAVTGTNGKSTVVRLIEAMAQGAGLRARAAGNLGIPALSLVGEPLDVAILEVSSFQLESVESFRPRVAVLLNVTPDHLDRHGDLDGYVAAKARLFARQGEGDHAILNGDDERVRALSLPAGVERLEFRKGHAVLAGAWLDGRTAIVRRGGTTRRVDLDFVRGSLARQDDNVLAALLAVACLDVDLDAAVRALARFEGLPHRCVEIATIDGVRFVDDSKATNVGAAVRALENETAPIVWIAGGRHKGGALDALATAARGRVRRALLIGEAAGKLEAALGDAVASECVGDLEHAVERAAAIASPGDVVLLAPACASFDQFENFEDRGRQFQAAVRARAARPTATREGARR